jgi:hypothetical protein
VHVAPRYAARASLLQLPGSETRKHSAPLSRVWTMLFGQVGNLGKVRPRQKASIGACLGTDKASPDQYRSPTSTIRSLKCLLNRGSSPNELRRWKTR